MRVVIQINCVKQEAKRLKGRMREGEEIMPANTANWPNCPNGHKDHPSSKHCGECGVAMPNPQARPNGWTAPAHWVKCSAGHDTPPNKKYCTECGVAMPAPKSQPKTQSTAKQDITWDCQSCNKSNALADKTCIHCGCKRADQLSKWRIDPNISGSAGKYAGWVQVTKDGIGTSVTVIVGCSDAKAKIYDLGNGKALIRGRGIRSKVPAGATEKIAIKANNQGVLEVVVEFNHCQKLTIKFSVANTDAETGEVVLDGPPYKESPTANFDQLVEDSYRYHSGK